MERLLTCGMFAVNGKPGQILQNVIRIQKAAPLDLFRKPVCVQLKPAGEALPAYAELTLGTLRSGAFSLCWQNETLPSNL